MPGLVLSASATRSTFEGNAPSPVRRARRAAARDKRTVAAPSLDGAALGGAASERGHVASARALDDDALGGATLGTGELSLARGLTAPAAGVLPVRFARLLPCRPSGIGMPLARGALGGGGVLLRAARLGEAVRIEPGPGPDDAASPGADSPPTALGPGAPRRGAAASGAISRRCGRLSRGDKSASSSESQSDGSGLPSSRLPE
jgi:hypothetical protein